MVNILTNCYNISSVFLSQRANTGFMIVRINGDAPY
jgi:hypothetical protein